MSQDAIQGGFADFVLRELITKTNYQSAEALNMNIVLWLNHQINKLTYRTLAKSVINEMTKTRLRMVDRSDFEAQPV